MARRSKRTANERKFRYVLRVYNTEKEISCGTLEEKKCNKILDATRRVMTTLAVCHSYTKCSVNRLRSSYIRCMKIFCNYPKYYSVTAMLLELGMPSFDTLLYNSRVRFGNQVQCSQNSIIAQLRLIL